MSENKIVTYPIDWESDDDLNFVLANQMLVNFDEHNHYLRFYQISPPTAPDSSRQPDTVKAKLVGGIAVPVGQLSAFIAALEESRDKHAERVEYHARIQSAIMSQDGEG